MLESIAPATTSAPSNQPSAPAATSQAAVFTGANQPLELRTFPLASPPPGHLLVRIRMATLCGSDLHTCQGHRHVHAPMVLGHEMVGTVEAIGPGQPLVDLRGLPVRTGDRVIWSIMASCGRCFFCTHDLPQKCEQLFKYGHETITDTRAFSGAFAEHCYILPGTAILRLPDDLPDTVACPAPCATATVAAAFRLADDCRGQTVLVQGLGALGLTACAMAAAAGAQQVIGMDLSPAALARAAAFGATDVVSASDPVGLAELIANRTGGRGVDLALELSGSVRAMETGLRALRIGGSYIWVGAVSPGPDLALSPEFIVRRLLTIRGSHNYQPGDLLAALDFLVAHHHQYPFADLVADRVFPLADINAAIAYALEHRPPRVAIRP